MTSPARQIPLPLPHRAAMGREDFMVTPSNRDAVAWLDRWQEWPQRTLILHGPHGSGKTHLVHVWQALAQAKMLTPAQLVREDLAAAPRAVAIDGADGVAGDRTAEEALLHLYNIMQERGGALLLTATAPPKQWNAELADLRSRLLACTAVALASPDDQLVAGMMMKQFSDRQLPIGQDVLDYLLPRVERHPAAIARIVAALDEAAMAAGRAVTIPLARKVLEEFPPLL
ncbi:MAG: DNA replication protein [Alphaproteobacteria bacterium]|nr:DNA replication protein [Alphaproteobacteria bacterium]